MNQRWPSRLRNFHSRRRQSIQPTSTSSFVSHIRVQSIPQKTAACSTPLLGYILNPDFNARPDIYQVLSLACQLADRQCTVQNLHVSHKNTIHGSLVASIFFFFQNVTVPAFDQLSESHCPGAARESPQGENAPKPQPGSPKVSERVEADPTKSEKIRQFNHVAYKKRKMSG